MGRVEIIVFNGITYRRYPDANGQSAKRYFQCGISDRLKGFSYLHRDIWKFYKGPIAKENHIHHKDEDFNHNEIDNFESLSPEEHTAKHPNKAWAWKEGHKNHLQKIRPLAAEWHGSDEGKRWHRSE